MKTLPKIYFPASASRRRFGSAPPFCFGRAKVFQEGNCKPPEEPRRKSAERSTQGREKETILFADRAILLPQHGHALRGLDVLGVRSNRVGQSGGIVRNDS